VTGRIVAAASARNLPLHRLPLEDMRAVEPNITEEVFGVLSATNSVRSRTSYGGTAPRNVRIQAKRWLKRLGKDNP
jgi:argininosuccinate lyase